MQAAGTKDRILDATAELFRRYGYTGTGMKQIVAEAKAPFGSHLPLLPGGKEQLGRRGHPPLRPHVPRLCRGDRRRGTRHRHRRPEPLRTAPPNSSARPTTPTPARSPPSPSKSPAPTNPSGRRQPTSSRTGSSPAPSRFMRGRPLSKPRPANSRSAHHEHRRRVHPLPRDPQSTEALVVTRRRRHRRSDRSSRWHGRPRLLDITVHSLYSRHVRNLTRPHRRRRPCRPRRLP